MDGFIQDLRHGARLLIRSPGFTFISLVTLGLGIGANTAIFSAVRAVLIRPLPFARADRIVALRDVQPQEPDAPASYPEYVDWKASGRSFTGVAGEFEQRGGLTGAGDPLDARTLRVSAGLLDLLGVQPALGRGFLEEEERADGPRAVILCHALWQERFGSDPGIVGKSVTIDGQGHSVIGVLPAGFRFGSDADLWLPLRLDEKGAPRGLHFLEVFGRLR